MAILVDYRCDTCGDLAEAFVATPAPSTRACAKCDGVGRRTWSPVGLMTGGRDAKPPAPSAPRARARKPLCATNPGIPGLCHMSESAGRAWIARARGDHRALDRELARQEQAAKESVPTMSDAVTHSHFPGDAHTHA